METIAMRIKRQQLEALLRKLDRLSGLLRRAAEDPPTLEPEFQKDERIGALTFACEYARAQLQEVKELLS